MQRFFPALITASMITYSGAVFAADPAVPTSALPTSVPAERPTAPQPQPITAELNDGSIIQIDTDGSVWVLGAGGSKVPAPDGTLTLKDGTPFMVMKGKRVAED